MYAMIIPSMRCPMNGKPNLAIGIKNALGNFVNKINNLRSFVRRHGVADADLNTTRRKYAAHRQRRASGDTIFCVKSQWLNPVYSARLAAVPRGLLQLGMVPDVHT